MKKILNILVIISLIIFTNSCKKNNIDIVDNTSVIFNKFYNSTENTKPVVKKVIEQIKQSGRYNDLEKFVTKYGFPKWDKALNHPKNKNQLDDDSSATAEYVIIPTVIENDNKVNGFIAVETTVSGINFQTYLGTDYKRFPYKSSNISGATAELIVGIMLVLENETFGYEKFSITDSQLSFYRAAPNNTDIALLELIPVSNSLVGETCYYEQYWWDNGLGNWTPLGGPIAIFCWGGSGIGDITNMPDPGSGGGSGGGSTPPYNNDYEICKKNFDDFGEGEAVSEFQNSEELSNNNNIRIKKYKWICFKMMTYALISEETGTHEFTGTVYKPLGEWTWKTLTHDKIKHEGFIAIIELEYKDGGGLGSTVGLYHAAMDVNFSVTKKLVCMNYPFNSTTNFSKGIVIDVNQ